MKILVINCGSSSLKYMLLDMKKQAPMSSGVVERIGEDVGIITHKDLRDGERKFREDHPIPDHDVALRLAVDHLTHPEHGAVAGVHEIDAVGHRVVQGGETFKAPAVIDKAVTEAIRANIPLAPLHNPANLTGIEVALELFPKCPQVAVFDTEFHQTMPPRAYIYALPYRLYEELRVRRYGFHGTSHRYVARTAAKLLGKPLEKTKLITVHLGNGSSIAAVDGGRCVDTSMGLTPLAGLMMGTRCGDVDPAVFTFLADNKGMSIKEIDELLNKQSGLKGICGMNDMRDIHEARAHGDEKAQLAFEMFAYRVKKYIGAYLAVLGGADAVVFTAGIGENDDFVREAACSGLEQLGIIIDQTANQGRKTEACPVHRPESPVQVWVVPTDEELEIALASRAALS
ncbi:acetate/propionate family kinase [Salidesulfovibrio onnuriiensis]|uniref:acetate/propionate family kinase n=1 Tax=Salidesulfovibrio onnuriiensis TaxID=2583823 RepID=UPI0011C79DEF|nr:acetate kinase [Salidesulfovibrio onnuriiensis]